MGAILQVTRLCVRGENSCYAFAQKRNEVEVRDIKRKKAGILRISRMHLFRVAATMLVTHVREA